MLSPVSFGNVSKTYSPEEFQQLISKPQAFSVQNTAVASTPVEDKEKSKGGTFKKFLIGAAAVIAAAVLLAEGAKRGTFKVSANTNGVVKTIMNCLNTVGTAINKLFSSASSKIAEGTAEVAEKVSKRIPLSPDTQQRFVNKKFKIVKAAEAVTEAVQEVAKDAPEVVKDAAEAVVK